MRLLALCLAVLASSAASAQAGASASGMSPPSAQGESVEQSLDVLPAAADATVIGSAAAALGVAACVIVTGLTQEDVTFNQSLIVAGVCGVLAGAAVCVNAEAAPERVHAASGAVYDARALAAFAADHLSPAQRATLAETARENGRTGVVLQRVVERRAGVGRAASQVILEVAVVDAATGALQALGGDALVPRTVMAVPVGDDLPTARAEALAHFTL